MERETEERDTEKAIERSGGYPSILRAVDSQHLVETIGIQAFAAIIIRNAGCSHRDCYFWYPLDKITCKMRFETRQEMP